MTFGANLIARQLHIVRCIRLTPGDLNVNRQMIGKGEAMKVGEEFGIKITEIYTPDERAALLAKSFGRPISST